MSEEDPAASRPELLRDIDIPGAWSVVVDGTEQSWVDPADPSRLEFGYMQRIGDALDLQAPAGQRLRVIHIGGAGMALARYVAHTRPSSAQIVLEPDADLTQRVREQIPLPRQSGIKVRAVDGRSGIAAMRDDYADVIIVDAFVGRQVPADLVTTEFYADVARVLTGSGTVMVNLTDWAPFEFAGRAAAGLGSVFPHASWTTEPATLKGRRLGNIVLLGRSVPLPYEELAARAGRGVFPYRMIHGPAWHKLLTGRQPITDAEGYQTPTHEPSRAHFG